MSTAGAILGLEPVSPSCYDFLRSERVSTDQQPALTGAQSINPDQVFGYLLDDLTGYNYPLSTDQDEVHRVRTPPGLIIDPLINAISDRSTRFYDSSTQQKSIQPQYYHDHALPNAHLGSCTSSLYTALGHWHEEPPGKFHRTEPGERQHWSDQTHTSAQPNQWFADHAKQEQSVKGGSYDSSDLPSYITRRQPYPDHKKVHVDVGSSLNSQLGQEFKDPASSNIEDRPIRSDWELVHSRMEDGGANVAGKERRRKKNKRERGPRIAIEIRSDVDILDDGFKWRKYGQKPVKNSRFPRNYYKCTEQRCDAKKHVERQQDNPEYVLTTYEGTHNHYTMEIQEHLYKFLQALS